MTDLDTERSDPAAPSRPDEIGVLHAVCDLIEDGVWAPRSIPGAVVVFGGAEGPPLLVGQDWAAVDPSVVASAIVLLANQLPESPPGRFVREGAITGILLPGGRGERALLWHGDVVENLSALVLDLLRSLPARLTVGHLASRHVWSSRAGRAPDLFDLLAWLVDVRPAQDGLWAWNDQVGAWVRLDVADRDQHVVALVPEVPPYGGPGGTAYGALPEPA